MVTDASPRSPRSCTARGTALGAAHGIGHNRADNGVKSLTNKTFDPGLSTHLTAIHAAPRWLWPALVPPEGAPAEALIAGEAKGKAA